MEYQRKILAMFASGKEVECVGCGVWKFGECGVWKFGGWGVKCGSVMRVWRMGV